MDEPSAPSPLTLGSYLKRAREQAGLGLRGLAKATDVPFPTIQRLENDDVQHPSPIVLQKLAHGLDLDIIHLFALLGVRITLPALPDYLKAKYPHLSTEALTEAQRRLEDILQQYKSPDTKTNMI